MFHQSTMGEAISIIWLYSFIFFHLKSKAQSLYLYSVHNFFTGVAVGSGWQAWVAYINLGCYYIIGLPLGIVMGWVLHLGVAVRSFPPSIVWDCNALSKSF